MYDFSVLGCGPVISSFFFNHITFLCLSITDFHILQRPDPSLQGPSTSTHQDYPSSSTRVPITHEVFTGYNPPHWDWSVHVLNEDDDEEYQQIPRYDPPTWTSSSSTVARHHFEEGRSLVHSLKRWVKKLNHKVKYPHSLNRRSLRKPLKFSKLSHVFLFFSSVSQQR